MNTQPTTTRPMTALEQKIADRWFGRTPWYGRIARKQMRAGTGPFCVVSGDYSGVTTKELRQRYDDLINRGLQHSYSGKSLARELGKRFRDRVGHHPQPTGPEAA